MKISLQWIKNYVPVTVSVEKLVERLTMAGIEAEKVEKKGNDTVIEFEITPNRPDCLNMWGMAREISASLNKPLSLPKVAKRTFPKRQCDVTIKATQGCLRYIGTVVENVTVKKTRKGELPGLESLGNRLINNIVDVTNFCLFETGQPLHAFDLDKLEGKKIIVRFAKKGETIVTLDGVERELDPSVLVIADAKKPVALAGIMGGANSEVTAKTKNILLESAYFDPVLIRKTARTLGLASDSSYRFERGVVYDNVKTGSERALDLILKEAGGTLTQYVDVKAGKGPKAPKPVSLDISKMNAFLGAEASCAEVKRILKALGFSVAVQKKGELKIGVPVSRADVQRDVDVYEEIARVVGYDNLPSSFPIIKITGMHSNKDRIQRLQATDYLLSQGFNEVLTYSLINKELIDQAGVSQFSSMDILNPLSKEQEALRPHVLPSLLQVVHTNVNRGQKDLAFFETGKIYPHGGEKEALGMIMTGCLRQDWRNPQKWPFDFFDLKGAIDKMLFQMGFKNVEFCVSDERYLEEGQRAEISIGKKKIGDCGKVADAVLKRFDIKQPDVFFGQVDLDELFGMPRKKVKYLPICEYPSITRDVSISVDKKTTLKDVYELVKTQGSEHLKSIDFKEEYLGDKIASGQRGLVFSVLYQSNKRTLTEEEIQAVHDGMCQKIVDQLGATIR